MLRTVVASECWSLPARKDPAEVLQACLLRAAALSAFHFHALASAAAMRMTARASMPHWDYSIMHVAHAPIAGSNTLRIVHCLTQAA